MMMPAMPARSAIEESVLKRIRPVPAERQRIAEVAAKITGTVNKSGIAEGMIVGSIARNTWVAGEQDIDIFLLFPPDLPREDLEERGLALARRVAGEFTDKLHEKYAEHPYIHAVIDGYEVDLVPCYAVESAAAIKSAVDRTPFHTRYIREKINSLIDDVLLLKQFARAGGIYGSDQMTEGFSGYLCELLILHYRGFIPLLEAASAWRPGFVIDPEHHGKKKFDEPLIVIDPVDPKRNVAAAVSLSRMMGFVELARGYLSAPSLAFFDVEEEPGITKEQLAGLLEKRKTYLFSLTFAAPPLIPEIVVPQLKRSVEAIAEWIERNGFPVQNARYELNGERCMLLFELLVHDLPAIRTHLGPPVWNRENAEKFFEKYGSGANGGMPYITNGKYAVEVPREYADARTLFSPSAILNTSLGKHVRQSLEQGFDVAEGADCWQEEFAPFIAGFLKRASPLVKTRRKRNGGKKST